MTTHEQVKPHIFVSYSRKDRLFAERLVNDLQQAGAEVWWDVERIIEGDFQAKINEGLRNCEWFVLVLTPNAIESDWVNDEMNAARQRRKQGLMLGVFPLLAATCERGSVPPLWDALQRYDATVDYEDNVAKLMRAIGLMPQFGRSEGGTLKPGPISDEMQVVAHVSLLDEGLTLGDSVLFKSIATEVEPTAVPSPPLQPTTHESHEFTDADLEAWLDLLPDPRAADTMHDTDYELDLTVSEETNSSESNQPIATQSDNKAENSVDDITFDNDLGGGQMSDWAQGVFWRRAVQRQWESVKQACKQKKRPVAALLQSVRPVAVNPGNPLEIVLRADYEFHFDTLSKDEARAAIEWALEQILHRPCRIRLVMAGDSSTTSE